MENIFQSCWIRRRRGKRGGGGEGEVTSEAEKEELPLRGVGEGGEVTSLSGGGEGGGVRGYLSEEEEER